MFSSVIGLELLSNAKTWLRDGTNSTTPSQFTKLFVIRLSLGTSHVSAVYALILSKYQGDIEECLTALLNSMLPSQSSNVADYHISHRVLVDRPNLDCHILPANDFFNIETGYFRYQHGEPAKKHVKSEKNKR